MRMESKKPLLAIAVLSLVSGCSSISVGESEFSCEKDKHQGVSCMSAHEVYELTHDRDNLTGYGQTKEVEEPEYFLDHIANLFEKDTPDPADPPETQVDISSLPDLEQLGYQSPVSPPNSYAIRTEPKQLIFWIAPYTDGDGDFQLPGYTLSEIEGRTWKIGNDAIYHSGAITPMAARAGGNTITQGSSDTSSSSAPKMATHNKVPNSRVGSNPIPNLSPDKLAK